MTAGNVLVGWEARGRREQPFFLPLSTLLRHQLVTGTTGWGKSSFLISQILSLLRALPEARVLVIDPKGDLAPTLRDTFLPALSGTAFIPKPEEVLCIEPFGASHIVPLNPLARVQGISPESQAHVVTELLSELLGDGGLAPRMRSVISSLIQIGIAIGGSLADVRRLVVDEPYRVVVADQLREEVLRVYLQETLPREPASTIGAVRARLEWLLLERRVQAHLCAKGCISGPDLIENRLTFVDTSHAPMGFLPAARFIASFIFTMIASAVFTRRVDERTAPLIVAVDEWQELARAGIAEEIERLASLARYKKTSLILANQSSAQISEVSRALEQSLLANVALRVLFRPAASELREIVPLLAVTGAAIDPQLPDRLLTLEEERRALTDRLLKLPPRHALVLDRVAGRGTVIRTLGIPFEEAARRAKSAPSSVLEAYRKGRIAVPFTQSPVRELAPAAPSTQTEPTSIPRATHATGLDASTPTVLIGQGGSDGRLVAGHVESLEATTGLRESTTPSAGNTSEIGDRPPGAKRRQRAAAGRKPRKRLVLPP